MTDKVFGAFTPLETKQDVPGAGAGYGSNYLVTAAEMNNQADLLNQLRDAQRTHRIKDIGTTAVAPANEANYRVTSGRLEVSIHGGPWRQVARTAVFDVTDEAYGAKGDGTTDDAAAIDAAILAAVNREENPGNPYGGKAIVWFPPGCYRVSHPIFVNHSVELQCQGKNDAVIVPLGFLGPQLLIARPPDDPSHSHGPFALGTVFNVSGQMTYAYPGHRADDNFFYDIAQTPAGRLPHAHDWTVDFWLRFDDVSSFAALWSIFGSLYPAIGNATLQIIYQLTTSFRVDFTYNGQVYSRGINLSVLPTMTVGSWHHFAIQWDNAAGGIRLSIDGIIWNDGNWVPSGAGGSPDGSGWEQKPWEAWALGMGTCTGLHEELISANVNGSLAGFRISNNVRWTSNFTPPARGSLTADANTQLLINFDQFYKGCLVGDCKWYAGFGGLNLKVIMMPTIAAFWETPQVVLRNLFFYAGGGIRAVFASALTMDNVTQLGCDDGWRFNGNGYFARITACDVVAGQGRIGFYSDGSYIQVQSCTMANPIGFAFDGANVFGFNNVATVHPNCYMALFYQGGGILDWTGFAIDAEEASTVSYEAAAIISDPAVFRLSTSTLYGPTNKRTTHPIVKVYRGLSGSFSRRILFESCAFAYPPSAGSVFETKYLEIGGSPFSGAKDYAEPVIINHPLYYSALNVLGDRPANFLSPTDVLIAQNARMGSGPPGSGTWAVGNVVWNNAASPAVGDPAFWRCDVAGSPGTWHPYGARIS